PPAVQSGTIALSIRRQMIRDMSLKDWVGSDPPPTQLPDEQAFEPSAMNGSLPKLHARAEHIELVQSAVRARKNILISGGTSSGKTTFLNACLKEIPVRERIITIEDAREVYPPQPNRLHLLASRGEQGRAKISAQQLLEASLRLRPDRIILGEIRGTECVTY